jgi:outer membrane receptor protein involved in Fe transport
MRLEDWNADYFDSNKESFIPSNTMNGGKLSLINNYNEDSSFFISVAKGYKQGGFNLGTGLNESSFSDSIKYDPETLINYELGLDKFFPDSKTNLDLVLFLSDRQDQQVLVSTQVDPQDPNTFLYLTRNAAEGQNYGAELSVYSQFTDRLNIYADLGILRTKIQNYASRPDLEGRDQAHAPNYSFSAGLNWKIYENFEFHLDITGKSDFYYSDSHNNQSDDYVLTNLNFYYKQSNFTYNFWVRNLFDKYYSLRGFYFGNEPPNFEDKLYERHGDPRNLGISIQYEF